MFRLTWDTTNWGPSEEDTPLWEYMRYPTPGTPGQVTVGEGQAIVFQSNWKHADGVAPGPCNRIFAHFSHSLAPLNEVAIPRQTNKRVYPTISP